MDRVGRSEAHEQNPIVAKGDAVDHDCIHRAGTPWNGQCEVIKSLMVEGGMRAVSYRNILVPMDGSRGSWKALRKALLLATEQGAEVTALSVEEHLPRYAATVGEVEEEKEQENAYFAQLHTQAAALARERGLHLKTETLIGHAAQTIVRYADEQGFDLIVIGHSGHSGVWGMLLGSTTDRVVDRAPCDVLVVR